MNHTPVIQLYSRIEQNKQYVYRFLLNILHFWTNASVNKGENNVTRDLIVSPFCKYLLILYRSTRYALRGGTEIKGANRHLPALIATQQAPRPGPVRNIGRHPHAFRSTW